MGACAAAAVSAAIIMAVVDLYVVGHGHRSLLAPIPVFEPWGISLGLGDMLMLVMAAAAGIVVWLVL